MNNEPKIRLVDATVYDTSGREIIPIRDRLSICTNRHPNCDGTLWGWIEGCTNNVCWSNNKNFNYDAARKFVDDWNREHGISNNESVGDSE
jgi:hypothetical protein